MANSVYAINKGINKPIEFKGFKAQYIWYLGGGMLILLILFAILYIIGLSPFICLGISVLLGTGIFIYVSRLSHKYGEHGLMKTFARKSIPNRIRSNSRKVFQKG